MIIVWSKNSIVNPKAVNKSFNQAELLLFFSMWNIPDIQENFANQLAT